MDESYADQRKKKPQYIYRYKTRADCVLKALQRHLGIGQGLHVLEFGSADGLILKELSRRMPGSDFLGIEYSRELIEAAGDIPEAVRLIQGDVTQLPQEVLQQRFDAVIALAVLEHLRDPGAAVAEAGAVLRPGGLFIATCPNPLWDEWAARLGMVPDDLHESHIGKQDLIGLARSNGLEFIAYRRFMFAPIGFLPYVGIAVSPNFSNRFDQIVYPLRIFDWGFVNQILIARKPR